MKVALIALYDLNSFSIRTLHAVLKNNNIDVNSLFFKCENPNNTMDKPTEKELKFLINFIEHKGYDVIGISVRSSVFSLAAAISSRIKEFKKAPLVILGGIEPTLNPAKCLKCSDIVAVGEGEQILLDICNGENLSGIRNIHFKKNGKIIQNPSGYVEEDLDKIPFPDFSDKNKYFFNNERILPLKTLKYRTRYSLMTGRGCPFGCTYCCNSILRKIYRGKYLRRRSVGNVITELKIAKKQFPNLMSVSFLDDVFTFDKEWTRDFSKKYLQEINLPFYCYVNPNMCDEETIILLKKAGFFETTMGVQTFSERTRKYYQRRESNQQILNSTRILKRHNIHFGLDIIMDSPIETEDDLKINLDWLLKITPPFDVHTHTMTYFPKTVLTTDFVKSKIISPMQVEDELEKGWERWTPSLDLKRDKINLLYDCLYFLSKSRFRSERLIRLIQRSKFFREHPETLARFIKVFSTDFLSLNWNSRFDRLKFLISQGLFFLAKGDFKFVFLKLRQQLTNPESIVV